MPATVLVVDDDDVGRATMVEILRLAGYLVDEAAGGEQALERLAGGRHDVMLLDLKMPGVDGVAVLQQAAAVAPETQVVVFTAHGSLDSAVQAIRHSAFDYLLKPAPPSAVVACVGRAAEHRQKLVRQTRLLANLEAALGEVRGGEDAGTPVAWAGLSLDPASRRLTGPSGEAELTPAELRLLLALIRRGGHVVEYVTLVDQVQGYAVEAWEAPGMLRPVVSRLRHKLEQAGGRGDWIDTVRGSGYAARGG